MKMHVLTLYKEDPTKSEEQRQRAEFYTLVVKRVVSSVPARFDVIERHGWWSEEEKRAVLVQTTLNPETALEWEAARMMYRKQFQHRIGGGYVHLFIRDPNSQQGYTHRIVGAEDDAWNWYQPSVD